MLAERNVKQYKDRELSKKAQESVNNTRSLTISI